MINDGANGWVIAGVTSGAAVTFGGNADYTRVTRFATWIDSIVDNPFDLVIDMADQRSGASSDQITFGTVSDPQGDRLTIDIDGRSYSEKLDRIQSITLKGSGSAETIRIAPGSPKILRPITISGGLGSDALLVDDTAAGNNGPWAMRLYGNKIDRETGAFPFTYAETINYSGMESVSYTGSTTTNDYFVYETPIGQQTTIQASPNADKITVYPRDLSGVPSIRSNIAIFGGGGADAISIDVSASTSSAIWSTYNPFGVDWQSVTVSGSAFISAFRDIEAIGLRGSQATDNFNLSSFMNGSSLTVDGGAGGNALNVGFSSPGLDLITGDLKAYFLLSGFTFNGGEGDDVLTIANGNNPGAWTYTRADGYVDASENAAGGYSRRFYNTAENVTIGAGPLADVFNVESTTAGLTYLVGNGGADQYNIRPDVMGDPQLVADLHEIQGVVRFDGDGSDSFFVNNRNDATGRTVHVTPTDVGKAPGDDLFSPGGYLEIVGSGQLLSILNGAEADTVFAAPSPLTPLRINGRNPTEAPGDVLHLSLAANPTLTPNGVGAGLYTFSNAAPITYLEFETVTTTMSTGADFNGDGLVDGGDLNDWKGGFGTPAGAQPGDGDANGDGDVDGGDFLAWQRQLVFGGAVVAAASLNATSSITSNAASGRRWRRPRLCGSCRRHRRRTAADIPANAPV